jgi:hypothetical protein
MIPVRRGSAALDEGAPGSQQFLQVIEGLANKGACLEFAHCSEAGQHGGIGGVGLGPASDGFGEPVALKRVYFRA